VDKYKSCCPRGKVATMKRLTILILALTIISGGYLHINAAPYLSADIVRDGDQYSDISMLAELPVKFEGPGWIIDPGVAWSFWAYVEDWIEYTAELNSGNWNIGLNAINHTSDDMGLGNDPEWYEQFEIKIEIENTLTGQIIVPASDTEVNNGFVNIDLLDDIYTVRFTWLNDKFEPSIYRDANIQINSVFFDRLGDYGSSPNDSNSNGIPDDQEVDDTVDLDEDGTFDIYQDDIKCVNTVIGDTQVGIKTSTIGASIASLKSIDPNIYPVTEDKPDDMPFGLFTFTINVDTPGGEARATAYFSEAVPEGAKWIKYNQLNGWIDYSEYATFSADRKSVTFTVRDGGLGDADFVENKVIVDPAGAGVYLSTPQIAPKNKTDGGGGGCFIATVGNGDAF